MRSEPSSITAAEGGKDPWLGCFDDHNAGVEIHRLHDAEVRLGRGGSVVLVGIERHPLTGPDAAADSIEDRRAHWNWANSLIHTMASCTLWACHPGL